MVRGTVKTVFTLNDDLLEICSRGVYTHAMVNFKTVSVEDMPSGEKEFFQNMRVILEDIAEQIEGE
jgi:hypothetical protein